MKIESMTEAAVIRECKANPDSFIAEQAMRLGRALDARPRIPAGRKRVSNQSGKWRRINGSDDWFTDLSLAFRGSKDLITGPACLESHVDLQGVERMLVLDSKPTAPLGWSVIGQGSRGRLIPVVWFDVTPRRPACAPCAATYYDFLTMGLGVETWAAARNHFVGLRGGVPCAFIAGMKNVGMAPILINEERKSRNCKLAVA